VAKSKVKWKRSALPAGLTRQMTVGSKRVTVKRRARVEVFKDRKGQWRFRLIAGNGEIIAQSEGYTRKYTATLGARRVLAAS
jgi:uncharacterized protein YegP (UPF0339 family)